MKFSMIVAHDQNRGIGIDNDLPWRLKQDMAFFKQVTTNNTVIGSSNMVIMGRKTWDSIPEKFRPLPGRINCVLSRSNRVALPDGVLSATSIDDALGLAKQLRDNGKCSHVFIIGGGTIYNEAIKHPFCEQLLITKIEKEFACDAFFPEYDVNFTLVTESQLCEESNIKFKFLTYIKR